MDKLIKCSPRPGLEVGIVPLPNTVTNDLRVKRSQNDMGECLFWNNGTKNNLNYRRLPPGSYTFLFCSNNVTEEECKEMIKPVKGYGYRNYEKEDYNGGHSPFDVWSAYHFKTALESLQSLLRSLGLDPSRNYAIILKNN